MMTVEDAVLLRMVELEACRALLVLSEEYRRRGMTADEERCKVFALTLSGDGHSRITKQLGGGG